MQETQETQVQSLGWKDHLEEEMATHSSIFARKISWTEDPGELQLIMLQRVKYDQVPAGAHKKVGNVMVFKKCCTLFLVWHDMDHRKC